MTDDEVIDHLLKDLGKRDPHGIKLGLHVRFNFSSHKTDKNRIIDIIEAKGLIKPSNETSKYYITQFGRDVNSEGGWIEHQKFESIKRQKIIHDATLSKLQVKTFWYVFGFGIWGGLTGTIALGLELQDRHSKWQKERSEKLQSGQDEVSTNSNDIPKSYEQVLHYDTLK